MKKKGFTLIELIIVIAIIGILAGILIPSWGYYMSRSRTRAQNLKAKAIFNAAQTFATDLKFAERRYINMIKDNKSEDEVNEAKTKIMGELKKKVDETDTSKVEYWTEWCLYFNGEYMGFYNPSTNAKTPILPESSMPEKYKNDKKKYDDNQKIKLRNSIKNIVNEKEIVYKIYVKDYKVVSVVSSRFVSDRYLGSYPKTLDTLEDEGKSVSDIRNNKVIGANMSLFGLEAPAEEPTT